MEPLSVEVLREVRDLLAEESRWTQGEFARDDQGRATFETNPEACRFCIKGAVYRQAAPHPVKIEDEIFDALETACGEDMESFNDKHTHAEVIALLDRVLAACGE